VFEDSTSRNGFLTFVGDFVSLVKAYPVTAVMWFGSIPVLIYSWFKALPTGILPPFPLHAYTMTAIFLVENYLRGGGWASLRKSWFWAAVACCLPTHAAILAALYYWDRADPGRTTFLYSSFVSRLLLASGVELIVLDAIFHHFRPLSTSEATLEEFSSEL
jgi:hypothetical protein